MPKKQWDKPKLTVLLKGRPEEATVAACKLIGGGSGADYWDNACHAAPHGYCSQSCQALYVS